MVRYETLPSELENDIRQLLQFSGAGQCSIHVEKVGKEGKDGQHWTVFDNDAARSSDNAKIGETTIYGIGSITKQLIALLLCLIIDKLSYSEKQEYENYRTIRRNWENPWDVKFTDLFNYFSDSKLSPLPRNPTLRHIALHYNSFPPMNHTLLAVDGTSIMSKDSFLRVAPSLAQLAYKDSTEDYNVYSNSNYIMIGYLIEAIGSKSLAVLLQLHLLGPLGMTNTQIGVPESSTSHIARPYSLSADGTRNLINPWPYDADSVVSSAFGAHSCTRDLAILFRAIQACLSETDSFFTKGLVADLLKPDGILNDVVDTISLFGLCTTMDTSTPGSKSYNRLIAPGDECSTYRLGYKDGDKEVKVYYLAGSAKGYSCSAYFLPKWKTFVIVLTNTTGYTDCSDHISRLILQKSFNLSLASTSKVMPFGQIFKKRKDAGNWASDSTKAVDIIAMSSLAAAAGKRLLQKLASEDAEENTSNPRQILLEGKYYNQQTEQTIIIKGNQAQIVGTTSGALGTSQPLGIIRTGDWTIRLRPLSDTDFTVDRYDPDGWQNLSFELSTGKKKFRADDQVTCITRRVPLCLHKFKRTETGVEES
jgi:CubicO group peptidase (beta-lactamase class C family)